MFDNLILNTDSYKPSMFLQLPPNVTNSHSYVESRGGRWNKTKFFGLQYILKEFLSQPILSSDVDEAEVMLKAHGEPFNREGWDHIVNTHGGYLPLIIRAIPEGMVVPTRVPLVTVESTDPACAWLVTYVETMVMRVWYPTTVATLSYHIREDIERYLRKTADNIDGLPFKLHDFGSRGVSSAESAAIGGLAHLTNFMGTDTILALVLAERYYGQPEGSPAGFSIPAAEHSTITAWGKENEADAYRNMLKQFAKPGAILAVVSDSYDIYNAVDNLWGVTLRQEVVDSGATLVIRPDSGDPATVVRKCAELLETRFGVSLNSRGFKVLNNVRLIQGDGINADSIVKIMDNLVDAGFSIDNIAFGMGGGLLQEVDRDTLKFAMKCSAVKVDGVWRDVYKDPITDPGKTSKKGRQDTVRCNTTGTIGAFPFKEALTTDNTSLMRTVFKDGHVIVDDSLDTIRNRE